VLNLAVDEVAAMPASQGRYYGTSTVYCSAHSAARIP
jgi:hypothetical protein